MVPGVGAQPMSEVNSRVNYLLMLAEYCKYVNDVQYYMYGKKEDKTDFMECERHSCGDAQRAVCSVYKGRATGHFVLAGDKGNAGSGRNRPSRVRGDLEFS